MTEPHDDTGWEHTDPDKWCRAPLCKDTNWSGYNRLHIRGAHCPAYNPTPEPNHVADFWESIREKPAPTPGSTHDS